MKNKRAIKKWLWCFSIPAAAILLFELYDAVQLSTIMGILAPIIGGFVLAFFLYRPSQWIEKQFLKLEHKVWQKLARPLSLTLVYLAFLGILALLVYLVIPVLLESFSDLSKALPDYWKEAKTNVSEWVNSKPYLSFLQAKEGEPSYLDNLGEMVKGLLTVENLQSVGKGVGSIASSLLNIILSFIVSIYMLSGREHLMAACRNFLSLFFTPDAVNTLRDYGSRIATIFYRYFYGAFLDALLVGIVISVGLTIFGVPYAILLGMTVGLMNMIPYFGAIIGGVGVSVITLLTTDLYTALAVAIYIVVVQQIDANIIQPRVVGESVGLRPIYVLLSITLFGGLFGFWGVFLAPPLMAIVQLLVREATIRRKQKLAEQAKAEQAEDTNANEA